MDCCYICPLCKEKLTETNNSYKCKNNHSFDISRSGYVNLLNPGKMNNCKAGDSKEMIRARTSFFGSGCYEKISERINLIISSVPHGIILDAGCGEGYYTNRISERFGDSKVYGFDMSKEGIDHASKTSKKDSRKCRYAVANLFDIPLESGYSDVIVSAFAPVAEKEFCRLLKDGGHLIVCSAGKKHLYELKQTLYDEVYENEEKFLKYDGFELENISNLKYTTVINGNDKIKSLFQMTPYYHRTNESDKSKLDGIETLSTTVEVNLLLYKKTKYAHM